MPTTTKSKDIYSAFIINAQDIEAIWKLCTANSPTATLAFSCSDSTIIEDDKIETIINFPNRGNRHITSVAISSRHPNTLDFLVRITNDPFIQYRIVGEDEKVLYISEKLENIFNGVRPWYSGYVALSPYQQGVWSAIVFALAIILPLISLTVTIFFSPQSVINGIPVGLPSWVVQTVPIVALIASACIMFQRRILRAVHRMYPPAIFAIGAATQRIEDAKTSRRNLAWSGIGAILISVAVSWFFSK